MKQMQVTACFSKRIILLAAIVVLATLPALASRTAAPKVPPVMRGGIRYVAPNTNGRAGIVEAWDSRTGRKLWSKILFKNQIDPVLEEDVQWIFIKTLRVTGNRLIAIDEEGRRHVLSLAPATSVPTQFTAVRRISGTIGGRPDGMPGTERLVVMGNNVRWERTGLGALPEIIIVRGDRRLVWFVYPSIHSYQETPLRKPTHEIIPSLASGQAILGKWKKMGYQVQKADTERIGKYQCDKYTILSAPPGTRNRNPISFILAELWVSKQVPIPVKERITTIAPSNQAGVTTTLLTQFQAGTVAKSLFDLPQGYRKMTRMPRNWNLKKPF